MYIYLVGLFSNNFEYASFYIWQFAVCSLHVPLEIEKQVNGRWQMHIAYLIAHSGLQQKFQYSM